MFQSTKSKVATIFSKGMKALLEIRRERHLVNEKIPPLVKMIDIATTSRQLPGTESSRSMYAYYTSRIRKWKLLESSLQIVIDHRYDILGGDIPMFLRQPLANIVWMSEEEPRVRTLAIFLAKVIRHIPLRDILKRRSREGVDAFLYTQYSLPEHIQTDTIVPPSPSTHTPKRKPPRTPPRVHAKNEQECPPAPRKTSMRTPPRVRVENEQECPSAPMKKRTRVSDDCGWGVPEIHIETSCDRQLGVDALENLGRWYRMKQ